MLVTGASGQIGSELVTLLRGRYGTENVLASDVKRLSGALSAKQEPFVFFDSEDGLRLRQLVVENNINSIVHLASLLSATGEMNPQKAISV